MTIYRGCWIYFHSHCILNPPPKHDHCPRLKDIFHYKPASHFSTMITMIHQDYARLPIFKGLTNAQFTRLNPYLENRTFAKGETIFKQGDPAAFLFILSLGEVEIDFKPYDGPPLSIAHINSGGVFGWSAALGRDRYTSAAISLTESRSFCITGRGLQKIFERDTATGQIFLDNLANGIAERLNSNSAQILTVIKQKWIQSIHLV